MPHDSPAISGHSHLPGDAANPLVVEVTRGTMVESRHRAAVAVVDPDGKVVRRWGDIDRPIYGRSAIKPLQALPLIESGAADRFGVGAAEIALACASHNGEPGHVGPVKAWLDRIGCTTDDLECGGQMPTHEATIAELIKSDRKPGAIYNNCSGKHTGFLCTARHLGEPTRGYIRHEHPVQQRILGVLEQMMGLRLGDAPQGIDGCGIPVIGIPLGNIAMAMARLADPQDLPPARAVAAKRIVDAMTAEPFMIGGTDRFCTRVMMTIGKKIAVKGGAEGVYAAALPTLGLGVALKVDDGAGRAAEVAVGAVLRHLGLLDADELQALTKTLSPPVINRAGLNVGVVRPAESSPF